MSKSYLYGMPVTDWMTPPAAGCEKTSLYSTTAKSGSPNMTVSQSVCHLLDQQKNPHLQENKQKLRHQGEHEFSPKFKQYDPLMKNEAILHPKLSQHPLLSPNTMLLKEQSKSSPAITSHCHVMNSLESIESFHQCLADEIHVSVDKPRSFHHSPRCDEHHSCYEVGSHRNRSKPPPKAIVTPLIGGLVPTRTHSTDTAHVRESRTEKATTIETFSDSCGNKLETSGGTQELKTAIEMKDKILEQKTRLIERQKQTIANLQQQLREKSVPNLCTKFKDLECEDISLKAQLMQAKQEIQQLSEKLSTVENRETALQHKCVHDFNTERQSKQDQEILKMQEKFSENSLQLKKLKEKNHCLDQKLATLQLENVKLVKECQKLRRLLFEGETRCRHELQAMRERHKLRFVEATAELRSRHKAMAKRVRALEVQLSRNSEVVSALNNELQISHGTIGDLKLSMKELVSQNQCLMEQNISLQEYTVKQQHAEKSSSDTEDVKIKPLMAELVHCVEDFESLVALCSSLLEGYDLNASTTLGVEGNCDIVEMTTSSEVSLASEDGIGDKLVHIKQLRAKVDRLRELVSEQFASQVSNACHVQ